MHDGLDHTGGLVHTHPHAHESTHAHLHTHTGEHAHQHEGLDPATVHMHEHTHETVHAHDHAHEDGHVHPHGDANPERAEAVALLTYFLKHNQHHGEELRLLQEQLLELGLDAAAEQVDQAIKEYSSGDAHLAAALEQARG